MVSAPLPAGDQDALRVNGAPVTRPEIILGLLAEGLSNQEIAQRSFIAAGTVKAHLKHIYGKLEVGNRTEAAAARELGLI